MEVGQLSLPTSVPPLRCENDKVERVRDLDLEPTRAAPAGLVGSGERLDHDPFVATGERVLEEALRLMRIVRLDSRHTD